MALENLAPAKGSVKKIKRVGRGQGSGMGKTNEKLLPSCPGANLLTGKVFHPNVTYTELSQWANALCI